MILRKNMPQKGKCWYAIKTAPLMNDDECCGEKQKKGDYVCHVHREVLNREELEYNQAQSKRFVEYTVHCAPQPHMTREEFAYWEDDHGPWDKTRTPAGLPDGDPQHVMETDR